MSFLNNQLDIDRVTKSYLKFQTPKENRSNIIVFFLILFDAFGLLQLWQSHFPVIFLLRLLFQFPSFTYGRFCISLLRTNMNVLTNYSSASTGLSIPMYIFLSARSFCMQTFVQRVSAIYYWTYMPNRIDRYSKLD